MQSHKPYVSHPKLWSNVYGQYTEKKVHKRKRKQGGKGLRGNRNKMTYIIPPRPQTEERKQGVQLVSPVAAIEERAKSEYKTEKKEKAPRVKLDKSRKTGAGKKPGSRKKKIAGSTSLKTKQRKGPKKQLSTKNNRKRKLKIDNSTSVWDRKAKRRK